MLEKNNHLIVAILNDIGVSPIAIRNLWELKCLFVKSKSK